MGTGGAPRIRVMQLGWGFWGIEDDAVGRGVGGFTLLAGGWGAGWGVGFGKELKLH